MVNSSASSITGLELKYWRISAIAKAKLLGIEAGEVDWLLQRVTTLTKLDLRLESYQHRQDILSRKSLRELTQLWQQRLTARVPLQYLAGYTHWRDFDLKVSPDVLIPRPETEAIVDLALEAIASSPELATGTWVDLGTGSGAIALALAQVLPKSTIYATDVSHTALNIAKENAKMLDLEARIIFKQGSWWSPLEHLQGQVSGMVANPPYIPTYMIPQLQSEVSLHEPHLALDGGDDGLMCLKHLLETAPLYLRSGGIWLSEIMMGQSPRLVEMLANQGSYHQIQAFTDLAGSDRFVLGYRK
ncbi:peptide chain release factor N(5)-glutamine methyltransferase [Gloeocapsa sp. PCC 73106]|uniref:peptide chain release factor N(5)-glutamine methyltransferase n=1 Tax=Gloeocapsa sp. PCC 73106 TaxID=102232 RepID=UPI0002AC4B56|nr:peptide chain release factor N(5)-glutamine methyltransferase [Gloeocapsa sp. PCC 73106]ELR99496.1 protein-(glutamine-N5) methyltransferase, release factor-specific [Gloeocapsa sp. PCC 73106]